MQVMLDLLTAKDTIPLILKSIGTKITTKYRPITSLPTIYKNLTTKTDSIYNYKNVENNNIIYEERKRCIRNA